MAEEREIAQIPHEAVDLLSGRPFHGVHRLVVVVRAEEGGDGAPVGKQPMQQVGPEVPGGAGHEDLAGEPLAVAIARSLLGPRMVFFHGGSGGARRRRIAT